MMAILRYTFPAFLLLCALASPAPIRADEVDTLHTAINHLEAKEYLQALDILMPMAIDGSAEAQFQIGWMFEYGTGIPQNSCTATVWFDKAARQGHLRAQRSMAFAYLGSDGVKKNPERAYRWLLHAIREGLGWAEKDISFFSIYLTPEQRTAVENTMTDWHAAQQPPADVIFIPKEAFRDSWHDLMYSSLGFGSCLADFTGTSVERFGPKVYRPVR